MRFNDVSRTSSETQVDASDNLIVPSYIVMIKHPITLGRKMIYSLLSLLAMGAFCIVSAEHIPVLQVTISGFVLWTDVAFHKPL